MQINDFWINVSETNNSTPIHLQLLDRKLDRIQREYSNDDDYITGVSYAIAYDHWCDKITDLILKK